MRIVPPATFALIQGGGSIGRRAQEPKTVRLPSVLMKNQTSHRLAALSALQLLAARAGAEFTAGFATADLTAPNGWRRTGGYEPTTCPLQPGCGKLLVQTAVKLLNELKP